MTKKITIILAVIVVLAGLVGAFWYFFPKCAKYRAPEVVFCTEEQKNVQTCIEIYDPVCAKVNIQCITAPCDPIYQTFPNSCFACMNSLTESYVKGGCTE